MLKYFDSENKDFHSRVEEVDKDFIQDSIGSSAGEGVGGEINVVVLAQEGNSLCGSIPAKHHQRKGFLAYALGALVDGGLRVREDIPRGAVLGPHLAVKLGK
jgi:hypothetical protein